MQTCEFRGQTLSRLGFGAMRLPLDANKMIDEAQVQEMVDYAIGHGVNYFDTAYPYHNGLSEVVLARCLRRHPRGSYYIATKYPGHQIARSYDPAATFSEQLNKCQLDSFDFYLIHNVYENSIKTYLDPRWGIIDYFIAQREAGSINHLGFSCHGRLDTMKTFLEAYGDHMEFCQIQLNYLDWTLQDAKAKCELLAEHGIPVWVMEPVRGGALANIGPEATARLRERRPDESPAAWAFRWLMNRDVRVILSGMSNIDQMRENVATFDGGAPLCAGEEALLLEIAEGMKDSVPCTACRYCVDSCPKGLDIPTLLALYNDMRVAPSLTPIMQVEAMDPGVRPCACIACGACARMCPQGIDIPTHLADFAARIASMPSWEKLCLERAETARRLREGSHRG